MQAKMRALLERQFKRHESRPHLRALLFCADERQLLSEDSVLQLLSYGAAVGHSPVETPIRLVTTGNRLLIAVNPGDLAAPGPLVSYGIYYEADRTDPIIDMVREIFDKRFAQAESLVLDSDRSEVTKGTPLGRYFRNLKKRFSLSEITFRLVWLIVGLLMGYLLGGGPA